jgi:Zn-dependent metalloprotease
MIGHSRFPNRAAAAQVHTARVHSIVPPFMVERILLNGTEAQRRQALASLKQSEHFRLLRRQGAAAAVAERRALAVRLEEHSAQLVREVFDAEHRERLPGILVRAEGQPATGDAAADEAYDAAGQTWALYNDVYGRNSIDDQGMVLRQTVHYGEAYNNAFWDGEQMVYGDGDGELFARFTADLDIVAHELTHGVTQYEANLAYRFQSGALNESFSDVFGALAKQRALDQTADRADWLIGATVLIGEGYALRSMRAPGTAFVEHPVLGTDPQPGHMDDFVTLPPWEDNGGVHINSGIPNRAFCLAATALGGHAWERAGRIWYRTLCDRLPADATFARCAAATAAVAREMFGPGSEEERAVQTAWREVGVPA